MAPAVVLAQREEINSWRKDKMIIVLNMIKFLLDFRDHVFFHPVLRHYNKNGQSNAFCSTFWATLNTDRFETMCLSCQNVAKNMQKNTFICQYILKCQVSFLWSNLFHTVVGVRD